MKGVFLTSKDEVALLKAVGDNPNQALKRAVLDELILKLYKEVVKTFVREHIRIRRTARAILYFHQKAGTIKPNHPSSFSP